MRRTDKDIGDESIIESIIKKAMVCRVAMIDGDRPYVVPLCFGYHDRTLYVHGALTGRKIDAMKRNPNVCFEFDINCHVVASENPCNWGMVFQSVIGFGTAVFLVEPSEKEKALAIIMAQYSKDAFRFSEKSINRTAVIKIEIESLTGKQSLTS